MSRNKIKRLIQKAIGERPRVERNQIRKQGRAKVYQQKNRKRMTNAEWACDQILKEIKREHPNMDYEHQYIFQKGGRDAPFFLLDFYIKSPYNLAIEIDGGYHDAENQRGFDHWRQEKIEACGIRVLRYRNQDICFDADRIKHELMGIISRSDRYG